MDDHTKDNLKHFFVGAGLTALLLSTIYVAFFTNALTTYAGVQKYETAGNIPEEPETNIETATLFDINGMRVIYTPHLPKGTVGRNTQVMEDTIEIEAGRPLTEIKETCEHELLHEKGASNENHKIGDYIYQMDEHLNSETCVRFIYELGRYHAES